MPNRTNDDLVKRHTELRETLIKNTASEIQEFLASVGPFNSGRDDDEVS